MSDNVLDKDNWTFDVDKGHGIRVETRDKRRGQGVTKHICLGRGTLSAGVEREFRMTDTNRTGMGEGWASKILHLCVDIASKSRK